MKIAIIGQGYVGLTVGLFASEKFEVVGYDLNPSLVAQLNSGISHVEGLPSEMLQKALKDGKYKATSDPTEIDGSAVVVIAVPTPLTPDRKPDLKFIESACQVIGNHLNNDALIINESTSYPGTVRNFIKPNIEKFNRGLKFEFSVSPERVDPGRLDWNQTNTPRLYAGLTKEASAKTATFYSSFCNNLVQVSSPEVAEAAKLFENTFRQVNIALVNEFAQIAHALNIPVREVLDAANTKPYGFMKFSPSAGVGGHCIPVDPSYLAQVAEENGVKARFIELANDVNLQMGSYIVERAKIDNGNSLEGKRVQLIGVAYKPNVADVRETPAEQIIEALHKEGAVISWHDPLVSSWNGQKSTDLGSDIAIVVTLHDAFNQQAVLSSAKYVLDTTGKLIGAIQL
jgi:UDP-N-acetyl-D-glucosamine dehydrogenase